MCPKENGIDEERSACPSPPSDADVDQAEDELIGVYSRTELIRLLLVTQKFTEPKECIEEMEEQLFCSLWDTINSEEVAEFYLSNGIGLTLTIHNFMVSQNKDSLEQT